MPTTPSADAPPAPRARLAQLRRGYGELPWLRRALVIYGAALLIGVLGMPLLLWVVGNRVLGPYTHGQNTHAGALALLGDFLVGLGHGSAVFWGVALGPAAFVLLLRLMVRLVRATGAAEED